MEFSVRTTTKGNSSVRAATVTKRPIVSELGPRPDADVLSYVVVSANERVETVWYLNTRGEVREELFRRREAWRKSDRFKEAKVRGTDEFCRSISMIASSPRTRRIQSHDELAFLGRAWATAMNRPRYLGGAGGPERPRERCL